MLGVQSHVNVMGYKYMTDMESIPGPHDTPAATSPRGFLITRITACTYCHEISLPAYGPIMLILPQWSFLG